MIGDRIRKLRKERGYSQQQLANKLNLTQGAVSQWENNQTVPGHDQLAALAELFSTSIDDLLGRNEALIQEGDDEKDKYAAIGKQILDLTQNYSQAPKTIEARIVSFGMDQLPYDDRQRILSILQTMYNNNPDLFKRGEEEDAP